jgi:hypothetical protein
VQESSCAELYLSRWRHLVTGKLTRRGGVNDQTTGPDRIHVARRCGSGRLLLEPVSERLHFTDHSEHVHYWSQHDDNNEDGPYGGLA